MDFVRVMALRSRPLHPRSYDSASLEECAKSYDFLSTITSDAARSYEAKATGNRYRTQATYAAQVEQMLWTFDIATAQMYTPLECPSILRHTWFYPHMKTDARGHTDMHTLKETLLQTLENRFYPTETFILTNNQGNGLVASLYEERTNRRSLLVLGRKTPDAVALFMVDSPKQYRFVAESALDELLSLRDFGKLMQRYASSTKHPKL